MSCRARARGLARRRGAIARHGAYAQYVCTACIWCTARSLDKPLAVAHRSTVLAARIEGGVLEAAGNDCQVAASPTCVCARVFRLWPTCVHVCERERACVSYLPRRISEIIFSRVADSSLPDTSHTTWIRGQGWTEREGVGRAARDDSCAAEHKGEMRREPEGCRSAGQQRGGRAEGRRGLVCTAVIQSPLHSRLFTVGLP